MLLLFEGPLLREGRRHRDGGQRLAPRERRASAAAAGASAPRLVGGGGRRPLGLVVVAPVRGVVVVVVVGRHPLQAEGHLHAVVQRVRRLPAPRVLHEAGAVQRAADELVVGGGAGGRGAVLVRVRRTPVGLVLAGLGLRLRLGLRLLAAALLEAVRALHLARRVEHDLDAVGALVVDAAAAHGLREVVQHRPRHARQVAQVAVLPLGLLHHGHGGESIPRRGRAARPNAAVARETLAPSRGRTGDVRRPPPSARSPWRDVTLLELHERDAHSRESQMRIANPPRLRHRLRHVCVRF